MKKRTRKKWEAEKRGLVSLKQSKCLDLGGNSHGGWTEYLIRNAEDVVLISKMRPPEKFYTSDCILINILNKTVFW